MKAKNTRYKKILVFSAFTLDFCDGFVIFHAIFLFDRNICQNPGLKRSDLPGTKAHPTRIQINRKFWQTCALF